MNRGSIPHEVDVRPLRGLMRHVNVVVAAPRSDPHGDRVSRALRSEGAGVVRLTATDFINSAMEWRVGGGLVLDVDGSRWCIDDRTTVWWRRPGIAEPPNMDQSEQQFVADEIAVLLTGILEAVGVRWVDRPWVMSRARLKVLQLAVAARLGVQVPDTLVAGSLLAARRFAHSGPFVAKAASSGTGIAPFVELVPPEELVRVQACPTLLQRHVKAEEDVRIVTIGDVCFAWSKDRVSSADVDWRAEDPAGAGFVVLDDDPSDGQANMIAAELGLSFSVQDWLVTSEGPVFLEVNVQGQWLFLRDAGSIVVPPLASHLIGGAT